MGPSQKWDKHPKALCLIWGSTNRLLWRCGKAHQRPRPFRRGGKILNFRTEPPGEYVNCLSLLQSVRIHHQDHFCQESIETRSAAVLWLKGGYIVREEYDFSNARPNPYARRLKKQITINIDESTIEYFKEMASRSGIPYQTLINLYLSDCAASKRQLKFSWI